MPLLYISDGNTRKKIKHWFSNLSGLILLMTSFNSLRKWKLLNSDYVTISNGSKRKKIKDWFSDSSGMILLVNFPIIVLKKKLKSLNSDFLGIQSSRGVWHDFQYSVHYIIVVQYNISKVLDLGIYVSTKKHFHYLESLWICWFWC